MTTATERKPHHYFGTLEDPRWVRGENELLGERPFIEFDPGDGPYAMIEPDGGGSYMLCTPNYTHFDFESEQEAFDFACQLYDEGEME